MFFGKSYGSTILFWDLLTFTLSFSLAFRLQSLNVKFEKLRFKCMQENWRATEVYVFPLLYSQCEAKCAFLALRIYCWRLRTKIVSLIKKPNNPIDTKTLKQLSSSFGTPKQNLCYYRSTMGSIYFWSRVWIENIYPQIVPLFLKTFYFSTVTETLQKRTASVACS